MGAGAVVDGIYRTVAWVVAGDAASHGHLLSPVHAAEDADICPEWPSHGSVLPGGGFQKRELTMAMGLRLQRLRRHRCRHHCQPPESGWWPSSPPA